MGMTCLKSMMKVACDTQNRFENEIIPILSALLASDLL